MLVPCSTCGIKYGLHMPSYALQLYAISVGLPSTGVGCEQYVQRGIGQCSRTTRLASYERFATPIETPEVGRQELETPGYWEKTVIIDSNMIGLSSAERTTK